jgi:hypothetical protein
MKLKIAGTKGIFSPAGGVVKPPGKQRGIAAGWGIVPEKNTTGMS